MNEKQFGEDGSSWDTFSDADSLEAYHNKQAEYDRQKEKRVLALREALEGGFMEDLTQSERDVFRLVYLEGLDKVAISHKLNKTYASIQMTERRAIAKLRSFLEVDRPIVDEQG
jgi:DNA-directed RNA polymerase specialized sigma24 family protein